MRNFYWRSAKTFYDFFANDHKSVLKPYYPPTKPPPVRFSMETIYINC